MLSEGYIESSYTPPNEYVPPVSPISLSEDESKYYGKKLKIKGVVGIKNLPSNVCVFGRYIMTCCIEDTEFKGFVCKCPKGTLLRNKEWVIITATLKNEYNDLYEAKGPVMYAEKIEHTSAPVEEVATFF